MSFSELKAPLTYMKGGVAGLPIVLDKFRTNRQNYKFWYDFFVKKGLAVVELSAREHDKLAANSQKVTHFS